MAEYMTVDVSTVTLPSLGMIFDCIFTEKDFVHLYAKLQLNMSSRFTILLTITSDFLLAR